MTRRTHWGGEPTRVWEEVWGVPGVEVWDSLGSTNDRARAWHREGARPWSVVLAERQSAGRGRAGRRWISEAGGGLWFSMIVPERRGALGLLPLRAGLAVVEVLHALHALDDVGLKWPNDIWWQDHKLGGILCERQGEGAIVGVGLNVRAPSVAGLDPAPVGLEDLVGERVSRPRLLGALVERIRDVIERGGARLSDDELGRLAERDRLLDRVVRCSSGPGGIARGIGPDGGLLVETEEGMLRVHTGSVRPMGTVRESGGASR